MPGTTPAGGSNIMEAVVITVSIGGDMIADAIRHLVAMANIIAGTTSGAMNSVGVETGVATVNTGAISAAAISAMAASGSTATARDSVGTEVTTASGNLIAVTTTARKWHRARGATLPGPLLCLIDKLAQACYYCR